MTGAAARSIAHVTLLTGHTRQSSRSEIVREADRLWLGDWERCCAWALLEWRPQ